MVSPHLESGPAFDLILAHRSDLTLFPSLGLKKKKKAVDASAFVLFLGCWLRHENIPWLVHWRDVRGTLRRVDNSESTS